MKKLIYILFLSLFLMPLSAEEEGVEEETKTPSNPQELLEIVKKGQFADSEEQRQREREFRNEKNKQAKLLRVPKFSEIPYPTIMEPSLVIEYYSR